MKRELFPINIGASNLSRHWYCDYEVYLKSVEGRKSPQTKSMKSGKSRHDWLYNRPKSKGELNVLNRFKEHEDVGEDFLGIYATRELDGTVIIAHPDDFEVHWATRKVRFVEQFTYSSKSWIKMMGSVKRFQGEIVSLVWEPIVKDIGFSYDFTYTDFWPRNGMYWHGVIRDELKYEPEKIVEEIRDVFAMLRNERKKIKPKEFKCGFCGIREFCEVYKELKKNENK